MEDTSALHALTGLVSRAQALVAELLRLSDRVPPVFIPETEPKYKEILFDFRYLKVPTRSLRPEATAKLLTLDPYTLSPGPALNLDARP
jgi:WASH complex subunit strumpellin